MLLGDSPNTKKLINHLYQKTGTVKCALCWKFKDIFLVWLQTMRAVSINRQLETSGSKEHYYLYPLWFWRVVLWIPSFYQGYCQAYISPFLPAVENGQYELRIDKKKINLKTLTKTIQWDQEQLFEYTRSSSTSFLAINFPFFYFFISTVACYGRAV